jgi:hypothetical protein
MATRNKWAPMRSDPLPQRSSAADTNNYAQPTPTRTMVFQTFWSGNQLPGTHIVMGPHAVNIKVSSQDNRVPQRSGGSFGPVLGQVAAQRLVARMQAAWGNARARGN